MEQLVLLVALAALLFGLHAAVVVYLYRKATDSTDPVDLLEAPQEDLPPVDDTTGRTDEHIACPTCGAPNDPSYRFCRRCISDLSGNSAANAGPNATDRLGN
ncbi:zinc ribbon domain-containing protein [Natronomonas sp.]|uniref:zinc ribbon domain-containing protein n=1 Tax=Natronomonas sp. TaxID=2184060 RepID=UPI002FC34BF3